MGNPKEDAKHVAGAATSNAHPAGSSNPQELAVTAAKDHQNGSASGIDAQAGVNAAAGVIQRKAEENIDQESKDKAKAKRDEYRARVKDYFSKKVPQERRDQTVWRLKVCLSGSLPTGLV